jgi:hypothetical protein
MPDVLYDVIYGAHDVCEVLDGLISVMSVIALAEDVRDSMVMMTVMSLTVPFLLCP